MGEAFQSAALIVRVRILYGQPVSDIFVSNILNTISLLNKEMRLLFNFLMLYLK